MVSKTRILIIKHSVFIWDRQMTTAETKNTTIANELR